MDITFFTNNAKNVLLEAEVHPDKVDQFEEKYLHITGIRPVTGPHYQHQPNKWGIECRIYFNCDTDLTDEFKKLDIRLEKAKRLYREEWKYRVNHNEFFWALICAGYRLGQN